MSDDVLRGLTAPEPEPGRWTDEEGFRHTVTPTATGWTETIERGDFKVTVPVRFIPAGEVSAAGGQEEAEANARWEAAEAREEKTRKNRSSANTRKQPVKARRKAIQELLADSKGKRDLSGGRIARRLAALHSDDCPADCGHVKRGKPWSERTIRGDLAAIREQKAGK